MIHVAVKFNPLSVSESSALFLTHDTQPIKTEIFSSESCSLRKVSFSEWKKLLKIIKVAQKVPSRICLGI